MVRSIDNQEFFLQKNLNKIYNSCSTSSSLNDSYEEIFLSIKGKDLKFITSEYDEKFNFSDFIKKEISSLISSKESYNQFLTSEKEEEFLNRIELKIEDKLKDWQTEFYNQLSFSNQEFVLDWFDNKYKNSSELAKNLLMNEFSYLLRKRDQEENRMVNLLTIISNYSYDELLPIGPIILTSSLSVKSDRVKEAVLKIFGQWENKETYNIIKKLEPPKGFLYRIQFESILKSFEEKYAISKEDKD